MNPSSRKPVAIALGTALAGLTLSGSAFAMQPLVQGYMLSAQDAQATAAKAHEGKCGEGKCGMQNADTDKDGRISQAEFDAAHPDKAGKFAQIDTNKDGYIDAEEHKAHRADKAKDKAGAGHKAGEGKCGEGKCGGMA